jgi:hypothetical protein
VDVSFNPVLALTSERQISGRAEMPAIGQGGTPLMVREVESGEELFGCGAEMLL